MSRHTLTGMTRGVPGLGGVAAGGEFGDLVTVSNSGFENGNLTGWTATVSSWLTGITGTIAVDNTTVGDGVYSCKMTLNRAVGGNISGYANISRTVTLEADTYYQFRFKMRGNLDNYTTPTIRETDSGMIRVVTEVLGVDQNTWRAYLLNFKTAADTAWTTVTQVSRIAENSTEIVWVDTFEIQKIISLSHAEYVIAAIGDSTVQHLGLNPAYQNDNPSSFLSTSIVGRQQTHVFEYMTPLNKGTTGNQSANVAARVQNDIVNASPKPRLCYVAVGTNDAAASVAVATYRANMLSTINTLRAGGVIPVIFTITPRTDAVNVTPYNAELADLAADEGVALFDAYAVFIAYANWATEWMSDAVHYNKFGHLALGRAVVSTIESLL